MVRSAKGVFTLNMSQSRPIEIRTAKQQFANVVRTLRRICSPIPVLLAEFDTGFKNGVATFEVDTFLDSGCSLSGSHLTMAAKAGCANAVAYINAQPTPLSTQYQQILSELTSELVVVALDGLSINPAIAVFRNDQVKLPGHKTPSQSKPTRCAPPSRRPSETQINDALQQIAPDSVHYRGCPNPSIRCNTCSSAFSLLDVTPCSHLGDWCVGTGYYPHFTARLMRRFADKHSRNIALVSEDLAAVTPSEVGGASTGPPPDHVHPGSSTQEDGPSAMSRPNPTSWAQECEDALANEQAMVAVVRDDIEMSSHTDDIGVEDSVSNVGRRIRDHAPPSRSTPSQTVQTRVKSRGKRRQADKRSSEPPVNRRR